MRTMRPFFSCLIFGLSIVGCGSDFDLAESPPGNDAGGDTSVLEADPGDTSTPPDTEVVDSGAPDTTLVDSAVPPDTTVPDTFVPACAMPVECPGTDDECSTRTCLGGVCGRSFKPAGTASATQTKGDCKRSECDGKGALVTVYDATDTPNDDNECTSEVCVGAVPKYTPVPYGSSCTKGGKYCDGKGACIECAAPSECPGADTECAKRTCIANKCGMMNTADGTPTAGQTTGDCRQVQCNGLGGIKSVSEDTDLPNDGKVCTQDVCSSGVASHPPQPSGLSCGGGYVCNGAGSCVQCLTASTCPTPTNSCFQATCSGGVCGAAYRGNDAPCTSPWGPGKCGYNLMTSMYECFYIIG